MEFRFNLEPIFTNSIIKVNSSLLPSNFRGDRRTALETTSKMAEIINTIGEYSAKAQGLSKPVTTAQKLRMSDQHLYILGDPNAGKNGVVIGLLKVGRKALYVFDENGETQTVNALCVLDFYIHESRQRSGLGKTLFEIMLNEEKFKPEKLAIDRPSDKLLGFLKKHYGLQKSIPQMNNFVIYEGFFDTSNNTHNIDESVNSRVEITASSTNYSTGPCSYSPNTALFGPQFGNDDYTRKTQHAVASNVPTIQSSPVGRYAAPRPACSMAEVFNTEQVIQNSNLYYQQQQVAQNYAQSQQQNIVNNGNPQMMQYPQQQQVSNQNQQIPQTMPQIVTQTVPQKSMIQNTDQSQQIIQNPIQPVPQQMAQHPVQVVPQQVMQNSNQQYLPQQIPQNIVQSVSQQTPQCSVQTMPQNPIQQNVQSMSQPMVQAMSQQVPQTIIQQPVSVPISQTMPQQMSQAMPQQVTQAMPQQVAQAMPQQVTQAMPQQVPQAIPQQFTQAVPQQMVQNVTPGVQQVGNLPPQQTINPNVSNQNVSSICFTSTGPFQTTEEKNEESSSILARRHRANGLSEDPQHAVYVSSTTTKHIHAAGKPSGLSEDPQHAVYVSSTTTKYIHPAGKPSGLAIERQRLHNVSDLGRPSTIAEQTNTNQIPSQEPFNQIPQVPVQNYQVPPPPIAINQVPPNVMSGSQVSAATAQIINQVPPPPINVNSQYQVYGQTNQNIQNISMEQQQQQQPQQFQQQQNQVYVPQNQIQNVQNTDSNARDFNLRGNDSFTSMKSRRFKADGLASDPQRVIHNAKFEASKMIPAGKPSGMRYNTGKLNGSSSSPGIPNPIDSIYLMGQMNTTNSMPNILGTSLAQSIPQQQINPMSVDKNAQMIQSVQVPTPQMVTTQMQNPQMVSNQVPTPQMVTTQVQNPQIVNPQQMGGQIMNPPVQGVQMINPQVIFPQQQLMNPPQVMNTQQSVGAPTANLQMMNSQMVNAQAPTNQAIMNQQLDQNIQMPVVQVNGQRVMNGAQIIKGQMMNAGQMQSLQVPQNETAQIQNLSQIIPTPRAINNQIVDGGQMGDGQMINNQMINPRMQNPQVLNTTNPSEPVQAQTNQEMYSKQTNFIPSQMNAQNQQQQQQIQ